MNTVLGRLVVTAEDGIVDLPLALGGIFKGLGNKGVVQFAKGWIIEVRVIKDDELSKQLEAEVEELEKLEADADSEIHDD